MEQLPKLIQEIAEYELVRHHYGARWSEILSGPVAAAVREIEEVSFGEIADFYPDPECTPEREASWDSSRDDFHRARQGLVTAMERGLVDDAQDALETLSAIEGAWGDDPATQRIRAILDH